jgi:hypothetical protein
MRFLVIVLALVAAGPAWAQFCQKEYATQPGRIEMIGRIEKMISDPLAKIEAVPPDVAQYIEEEQGAALQQHNSAWFNMVTRHQYYPALQVETHYKIVRENLAAAKTAKSIADQAVFLSVVFSRNTDFTEAVEDYIDVDNARQKQVLDWETEQDIYFMLPSTKSFVLLALQCGIRQMREPQ